MIQTIEFVEARLSDLEQIHELLDDISLHSELDESVCYALRLCIEEAFVNILDHGYPADQPGYVAISIQPNSDHISARIIDRAPQFIPQDAPLPDLRLGWDERQIGGLGWHLIRELMDEIRYEADADKGNVLTLVKYFKPTEKSKKGGRLDITVTSRGDVTIVILGGTIDAVTGISVSEMFKKQIAEGKHRLVADLGRVVYLSSAGVVALLAALKEARAAEGDLRVANAKKDVRKVLDLSGFSDLTQFFDSVDGAVKSFK